MSVAAKLSIPAGAAIKLTPNQVRGFWAAWGGWTLDGMDSFIYALVLVPALRELLPRSEKVRTAASETVRNGVRQAILVAEVKNKRCGGANLVDFIFNYVQGEWKLFSAP